MIDVPVLVKDAIRDGSYPKQYRFIVYEEDGETEDFTIDNNNLVAESVMYDERMCSDTNLKFGLCEGTSLEFQCFGVPNITGRRIQTFIDVQYDDEGTLKWHTIPMGWFDVIECSRQASTGILKMKCYNKLLSDYLDEKANAIIDDTFKSGDVYLKDIVDILLSDYKIKSEDKIEILFTTDSGYKDGQTAFRFTDLYGDQGVFSASRYKNNITTSTNCYFRAFYRSLIWQYSSGFTPSDYMRIESGVYNLNEMDQTMNDLIESQARKMITNKTDEALLQLIQNEFAYTFCIIVRINTPYTHSLYFSNTGYKIGNQDFDGDFSDVLNRLNDHVLEIEFRYPHQIYLMTDDSLFGGATLNFDTTENIYKYYETESSTELTTKVFEIPNFPHIQQTNFMGVYKITNLCDADLIKVDTDQLPDVTLRELQSAIYETVCQYGQIDRTTDLFSGVELNHSRLYPAEDLFPSNNLFPMSQSERTDKAMYSKLWADEGNVRSFRYLIITYKTTKEEGGQITEIEKKLQRTVNEHGTDNYNMSDNWLFRNLIWSEEDVGEYADAMVEKMRDIRWFPFEMWCAGLPYIETGDELEIGIGQDTYTSYVLRRTLNGIQNLQDQMINGTLDIF